jgi:hypothetical protein
MHKQTTIHRIKSFSLSIVASFLVVFYPMAAFAATTTDPTTNAGTTSSTTTPSTTTGPQSPTGSDASTYHYDATSGMWLNDHYQWNPTTQQTTPLTPQTYTYDPTTSKWNTNVWQYDPSAQQYEAVPASVTQPPSGAATSINNGATSSTTSTTGLNNSIGSTAQTGDAQVTNNTTGGSAASGSALDIANVINMLQSSIGNNGSNGAVTTFTTNIPGNVTGDLLINPASIAQNQGTNSSLQANQSVTVHNQNSGNINDAILLNATSGNASVAGNTNAGNATSGNAAAIANVVNLMNSSVGANQSFIGTVNIQGNLTGNILLPDGFLNSLIASNGGSNTTSTNTLNSNTTQVNNQGINNNINATASSGTASDSNNTTGGNATSGTALTNLKVMNLTGDNIIGSNALLVFVNVLGNWTGLIVNAPTGSTEATLGGGITQNNTSTSQSFSSTNTNNQAINNNITVAAKSGDASVNGNTTAGNATSGNAVANVNLSNIINSHLLLSNWFGILFINVLGTWHGNFGGSASNRATNNDTSGTSTTNGQPTSTEQVFQFRANKPSAANSYVATTSSNDSSNAIGSDNSSVATAADTQNTHPLGADTIIPSSKITTPSSSHINMMYPVIGLIIGTLILGSDRLLMTFRRR